MDRKPKIAILRWEAGFVPQGLKQLEEMPGNSTNLNSYPFPVLLAEVKGANAESVTVHHSDELLQTMIGLSESLVREEGIEAISTSCGFNAIFQKKLADALTVPVFTSSLLQIPFVQSLIGAEKSIGVITASRENLSREHFRACGITEDMKVHVMGMDEAQEWGKILEKPDEAVDIDRIRAEIVHVAKTGVKEHPNMGAIVLECTDLPPFAAQIREVVKLPVFDFISMMSHVATVLREVKLY